MTQLKAFLAGFLSTLVFHQGLLALLHAAGATPRRAFSMERVPPFAVPQVLSLAFWGGVWGILLWLAIASAAPRRRLLLALVIGAIAPTVVALLVVFPLKGLPLGGGWKPDVVVGALLLNGAWGVGVVLLMRLFRH